MDDVKKEKSKEEKLRELEFLFTSFLKKDVKFREDPVYQAIFVAIDRLNYKPFLPFYIEKDIRLHNPKVIEYLKENAKTKEGVKIPVESADFVIGRAIGSRLKQLKLRSILKVLDKIPEIRRQKTFALDADVKEKFEEYVKELLNEKEK